MAARTATELIGRLGDICSENGLGDLSTRLGELQVWIAHELADFEAEIGDLPHDGSLAHQSAHHLLDLGGKRLRPMCLTLAAKVGSGFDSRVRDLAVAVELIHNASLLHDDVIDVGERRRGGPTARTVFGNAASVIGGNWLLITALQRVHRVEVPGVLPRALGTVEDMIAAEALQLRKRGCLDPVREHYFRVVEGKTASLFRWALYAGAKAGGLPESWCTMLEGFGGHLGLAFQLVDDLIDYNGDAVLTGKSLFTDLREGNMTYPLLLALERDASLRPVLDAVMERPSSEPLPSAAKSRVLESLASTGALRDCLRLARLKAEAAVGEIDGLPAGRGRDALVTVAEAAVQRQG